jgi:hypothetical protein
MQGLFLTADELHLWLESQSEQHELVDGQPMPMAGATITHVTIVMNASVESQVVMPMIGVTLAAACRPFPTFAVNGTYGSYETASCRPAYFNAERQLVRPSAGRSRPIAVLRERAVDPTRTLVLGPFSPTWTAP